MNVRSQLACANADHVKLLLELFIGVIDAELLEAVHLESLEPV